MFLQNELSQSELSIQPHGGGGRGLVALIPRLLLLLGALFIGVIVPADAHAAVASAIVAKEAWCDCDGQVELTITGCQVGGLYRFTQGSFSDGWSRILYDVAIPMGGPNTVSYVVKELCPGTYKYSMWRQNMIIDGVPSFGFLGTVTVVVRGPEKFLTATTQVQNGNCLGSGTAVTTPDGGNGGNSFVLEWWDETQGIWRDAEPLGKGTQQGANSTGLRNGRYRVKVVDSRGCVVYSEFTIAGQGGPVDFTLVKEDAPCTGSGSGSASISNITGTTNYTITWSPGGPGGNASAWNSMPPGSYSVTVTDVATGCSKTLPFVIRQRNAVSASVAVRQSGCEGPNSGRIEVVNPSGRGEFTYTWSPSVSNSAVADNLAPGTYTVTVTDDDGCSWQQTVVIAAVQPLEFSLTTKNFRNALGVCRGRATIVIEGGTPPYAITWLSPSNCTDPVCEGPAPGVYTAEVMDANGCRLTQSIEIRCTVSRIVGISPNPFNGTVSVEFNIEDAHNVAFRLFDGGFQPVAEQYIGPKTAGTHTETLAFPGLSAGNYYLNLILDGEEQEDLLLIVKQ